MLPNPSDHPTSAPPIDRKQFLTLCVAALGVVYGDIGTSPLYAFRECFAGSHPIPPSPGNVLGLLSLVFWALMLVISTKYLQYVMRADNDGEGGILALASLAAKPAGLRAAPVVAALGLVGAGLLTGDGVITPAISVLSAIEGLRLVAPSFSQLVLPLTIAILLGLFAVQRWGTHRVGFIFGPVLAIWFLTIATLGIIQVVRTPTVLLAVDPRHAVDFFWHNRGLGFVALGTVFLAVTGGEALYTDMGHFGVRPIRRTWFGFVLPSLLLNYFGQGALLLRVPAARSNPFYELAPRFALVPLVVLATAATIIASQAVISGLFSLTRQATMLGVWPRVRILHTSASQRGQIYVPSTNLFLMVATIAVVLEFRASSNLAAAYGISVTGDMVITTLLAYLVSRRSWGWSLFAALPLTLGLLCMDLSFFSANLIKIAHGGWLPLALAFSIFALMSSWKHGRELLARRVRENLVPLDDFFELIRVELPARVPGTAVFMTSNPLGAPAALVFNFMHNHVVHERVVLLTVITVGTARVPEAERTIVKSLPEGFVRVESRFGFMETPDVPRLLAESGIPGIVPEHTTYFLGREAVVPERRKRRSFQLRIFSALARNSASVSGFFNLPSDRVLEIGSQVEL